MVKYLEVVYFNKYKSLKRLPPSIDELETLKEMSIDECNKLKKKKNHLFENLFNLQQLNLIGCEKLKTQSHTIGNFKFSNIGFGQM